MPIFENELISNDKLGLLENVKPILESPSQPSIDTSTSSSSNIGLDVKLSPLEQLKRYTPELKGRSMSSPLESASRYELLQNKRYPLYQRNTDLENIYGLKQSWYDQLGNGAVKMAATAVGTFAQSFNTIPATVNAIKNGYTDLSAQDSYEKDIDIWLKNLEDNFPNYYTRYEKDHPFLSAIPFYKGSANFWGDKIIKNLGFTAGAISGAIVQDAVISGITGGVGEIPLVANQIGKASLFLNKLFASTDKIDDILKLARVVGKTEKQILDIKKLAELSAASKLGSSTRWGAAIYGSARTEAAIEARDGYDRVREELVNNYKLENGGQDPDFSAQKEIDGYAEDAMNTRFGINMALLTVSNTVQFGNLFKSFTTANKVVSGQLTKELGEVGKIGLKEGSIDVFEKKTAEGISGKVWDSVRPSLPNILSEGVYEEGGQYATEKGVYDYFTRKYKNPKGSNWDDLNETVDSTVKGLKDQFGTSQGVENMLVGAISAMISGAVMGKIDSYKGEGKNARLQSSINTLNRYGLTGTLEKQYSNTLDSVGIANEMNEAIKIGNVFKYNNLKDDLFFRYVSSRVPQGMNDVTVAQLSMLKDLSKEDFEKTFGMDFSSGNKATVAGYVDGLIAQANNIEKTYKAIDGVFKNPFTNYINPETSEQIEQIKNYNTFNSYKEELTYLASKPENIKSRLSSLQQDVFKINPIVSNELISTITSKEGLKSLSNKYEQKANGLNLSLELATGEDKKLIRNQIKTLRTASEKINLGINNKQVDDKLFDYIINFELNGQDITKPKVVTTEQITPLFQLGHDIDRLNHLKDRVSELYDKLSTKEGFVKYFEQSEDVKPPSPKGENKFEFTDVEGEKQPIELNREYEIVSPKTGKVNKIAEDRWELTSPFKESTFYKTEELANEALSELSDVYQDLKKVKVLSLNEDGSVKVEDVKGNIYDIDPVRLTGYEKLFTEQEKLQKYKIEIAKQQSELEKSSGTVATNSPVEDISSEEPEEMKKSAEKLFISTTSASQDWENNTLKPHILRANTFLNSFKNLPNKNKIKAILVTQKQEESLGLKGLTALSMEGTGISPNEYNNIDEGFVVTIFVEQDGKNTKFIGVDGKSVGKVGEAVDINSIVFSTMPTTSLTWSNGKPRYRANEEEEAKQQSLGWKQKREQLFNLPEGKYEIFDFSISRGIPIITDNKNRNSVGETLVPESKISSQEGLIQISTTGSISHQGEILKFPKGRPVLQYGDTLQFLSNNNFTKKQAESIFSVIKAISKDVNEQISKKNKPELNLNYLKFLQNVLYWKNIAEVSNNKIFIDTDEMAVFFNNKKYDITKIADFEKEIVDGLQQVFNSVNDKTLKNEFNSKFTEYYLGGNNQLYTREWKNYQTYLLASKYPDGSTRSINDIPLSTSVDEITEAIPYNFKQKYAILQGIELPIVSIEKPISKKEEPTVSPEQTFKISTGDVPYTTSVDKDGDITVSVQPNEATKKASENKTIVEKATNILKNANIPTEGLEAEKIITTFVSYQIAAKLKIEKPVESKPIISNNIKKDFKNTAPEGSEYSKIGRKDVGRISEQELQLFKEWHKNNVPNIPYEVLENILYTHDNEKAWGVFENGVAKFYKKAAKGTEYHEIFEGVWKAFLTQENRQAILDEFKTKSGQFTDRASGKKIKYDEATDLQAKERIADDFADFRLGKITAKSLGQKIVDFFRNIIKFFEQFISKPSKKQELFNAIEEGKFKEFVVPERTKNEFAEYRKIGNLSEEQVNDFVQDITARAFQIIFKDNISLFSPEKLTSSDIFGRIKDLYVQEGKLDNLDPTKLDDSEFDGLVKRTKEFLKTFRIEFDEDNILTINDENSDNRNYAPEPFSTNWKKSSPYPVKLLLGTLTESQAQNQENNDSLNLPDLKLSNVNGYKLLNFSRAFATMLDKLSNTTKVEEVVDKITNLAKYDANYVRLFTRLKGNRNTMEIDFSKFEPQDWRLFINFYQTFTKQKPEAYIQYIKDGDVFTSLANIFTTIKNTQFGWIDNIRQLAKTNDSIIKYNKSTKTFQVEDLSKHPIKTSKQQIKFLNDIGITFPMEVYLRLKSEQLKKFTDSVAAIHSFLGKEKDIMSVTGKTLQINSQLTNLAELLVKVTNPNQDPSFIGIDGKRMQNYADNNAASVFENLFNSSYTLEDFLHERPELNDVFSRNSQILKKGGLFFDEDGKRIKKIKVGYVQGTNDTINGKEITTSKLSLGDRFAQEINQNLNGRYYILVPADSSTEWMMDLGNTVSYADVQSENWEKIYFIFNGYLRDDIALSQENRLYIKNIGNKGKELRIFKDILPEKQLNALNKLIKNGASNEEIYKYIDDNSKEINDSIKEFILSTSKETQDILSSNNVLSQISETEFIYPLLDDNFAKTSNIDKFNLSQEQINNVFIFVNTNYIISNIEFHKILFGDPYEYKIKEGQLDETKRIKSFLSPRRTTFDSAELNTYLNQNFNQINNIILEDGDIGHTDFKSYINTVTLADVEIDSPLMGKTNEADAASWILDSGYREVKIKNGQWSDDAEKWHQWQMAYTRHNAPFYKYKNEKLKIQDIKTLSEEEPKFVLEVLKPIVSGAKSHKGKIDIVLDKFSQMPLYYKAIQGTNLENLYNKMHKEGVGYVIFESGRKVGIETTHKLYNDNGSFNNEIFDDIIEVPWSIYGIQVENSYDGPKQQTRGSQITKLSSLDLFNNGVAISEKAGQEYKRNTDIINKMHKNAYNNLLDELGIKDNDGNFTLVDRTSVSQVLKQEMLKREMSENAKDVLELDENGQFKIPFEASTHYVQIRDILFSMVDKAIVSPKMNGGAHVQVPVTLWETLNTEKSSKLPTLKFYENEDGKRYCEVLLPVWFKEGLFKSKFKTEEDILNYINKSKDGQSILKGIGFRIPTQSQSSIEVFKVKGFLPDFMGKTVVVPSEITTKAGSDFDIDKLNMYLKSVYIDQNGDIKLVKTQGTEEETKEYYSKVFDKKLEGKKFKKAELLEALQILSEKLEDKKGLVEKYASTLNRIVEETDDIYNAQEVLLQEIEKLNDNQFQDYEKDRFVKDMYRKSLENEYYDSLEKLITLPENFDRLISPVDDAGLKKVAIKLDELRREDESTIKNRLLNRNYMTKQRHAFLTGKKWVGIAAVNITGQALTQKSQVFIDPSKFDLLSEYEQRILGDGKVVLPHNEIEGKISISGVKTADNRQYISERLSGYATSFVDVAKDPYILKIIKSDLAIGTFMFLERIGVGENTAYFMNQPIISRYLEYLESEGSRNLYNRDNIDLVKGEFVASKQQIDNAQIDVSYLASNILHFYEKGKFGLSQDNAIQHKILDEFLKYAKMAEYSFKLTQASNYDTTSFRSTNSLYRKQTRTQLAREKNIFNSVDKLLDSSFIGEQSFLLAYSSEALGEILKLDGYKYRQIINEVLKPYAEKEFFSDDKYDKVGGKIVSSFLDYIIQTKSGINGIIDSLLVNNTSVASLLASAKKEYPQLRILQDLEPVSSGRLQGATSIRLKVNLKEAYDENLYTDYMRELKEVAPGLYNDIIKLSILQGTYQSAISIKNIVPIEDYSKIVANLIKELVVDEDVQAFLNGAFQRNNWKDVDVFKTIYPKFFATQEIPVAEDVFGNEIYQYFSPAFPNIEQFGIKSKDRRILVLGEKYNFLDVQNDYLLVPRVVIDNRTGERIDMVTGLTVTNADFARKKAKGDLSLKDVFGYMKVKNEDGTPLTRLHPKEGYLEYIYKMINLWGDGQYASEYYTSPKPSVLNNGTVKIDNEIPNSDIIAYYSPKIEKPRKDESNETIPPCS